MAYGAVTVGSVKLGTNILTEQNGNFAVNKNNSVKQVITLDENAQGGVLSWNNTNKAVEIVQIGGGGGVVSNTVTANDGNSVSSSGVYAYVNSAGHADAMFTSMLPDLQSDTYMLQTVTSGSGQHTVSSSGIFDAIHNKIEFTQGIVIHSSREVSLQGTTLNVDMANTSYLTAKLVFDATGSVGNVDTISISSMSSGSTFVIAVEVVGTGTNTLSFDFPNLVANSIIGGVTTQITKVKKTQNTAIGMAPGEVMLLSGIMVEDILFMTINDNAAWY